MAVARIVQTFEDGTKLHVEIEVRDSYPDAVAEAKAQVVNLWNDVIGTGDIEDD